MAEAAGSSGVKKERRVPERRCAGCGGRFPKTALIRIVTCPDGRLAVDRSMKAQCRGTYICADPACLKKALKYRRIAKSDGSAPGEDEAEMLAAAVGERLG